MCAYWCHNTENVCNPQVTIPTYGRNTVRTYNNAVLFSTFNPRFPEWTRFRGATYTGVATHDPLAQNLVTNMLARGDCSCLSREVLMRIAYFATDDNGLHSKRRKLYSSVCRADENGKRLRKAAVLSAQIRRLLDTIPPNIPIGMCYRAWTAEIANYLCIIRPNKLAQARAEDPRHASHTDNNRLFISGLTHDLLKNKSLEDETRPAYLPNADTFYQWCVETHKNNDPARIHRMAEQIDESTNKATLMLQRYVKHARHRPEFSNEKGGCTALYNDMLQQNHALQERIFQVTRKLPHAFQFLFFY